MGEQWLSITGYEGRYEVSSLGRIRSMTRTTRTGRALPEKVMRQIVDRYGYACIVLHGEDGRRRHKVHRLVCAAFHGPPPPSAHAGHLDHEKRNNAADNLAWLSHSENARQNYERGMLPPSHSPMHKGEANPFSRLTEEQVRAIRAQAASGLATRAIARNFSVSQPAVALIVSRKRWAHVE